MFRAVVVGRSAGVMDDYRAACALCPFDIRIVVGKMGEVFPHHIDHWVSYHSDLFEHWGAARTRNGLGAPGYLWGPIIRSQKAPRRSDPPHFGRVAAEGGSSGLMAALPVAIEELEVDKVVLAGIPMLADQRHYDGCQTAHEAKQSSWEDADIHWRFWVERADQMRGRVRSMSGRTRDLLGAPTREWLYGD